MRERAFVLVPLAEISPDIVLPDGTPLSEALQEPTVRAQVVQEFGNLYEGRVPTSEAEPADASWSGPIRGEALQR